MKAFFYGLFAVCTGVLLTLVGLGGAMWHGDVNMTFKREYTVALSEPIGHSGVRQVKCMAYKPLFSQVTRESPVMVVTSAYSGNTQYVGTTSYIVDHEFGSPYKWGEMTRGRFSYHGSSYDLDRDNPVTKGMSDVCGNQVAFWF